jgi:formate hydrogenlyase transcriptional activator
LHTRVTRKHEAHLIAIGVRLLTFPEDPSNFDQPSDDERRFSSDSLQGLYHADKIGGLPTDQETALGIETDHMLGQSPALRDVMQRVEIVAGTDAAVLILGETGTGKNLVAHRLHRMSARSNKPFVKLNCAAIPAGLLESDLFGHEQAAFTGALTRKIGRLELAHQGTLFLDEIGDLPNELQPKLLRVLQEHEFERLGSNTTRRVNIRLVTATNHDLAERVRDKTFRSDLYYRLNVFPIRVPALRERVADIPVLARHFVRTFAAKMNRPIPSISEEIVAALCSWAWPGNVRELANFIERSVILTKGSILEAPVAELHWDVTPASDDLRAHERDHVTRVLLECKGNISQAAARLGLKRTTLQSMVPSTEDNVTR